MAVPHDLALSLLVGNGIPVSATDGVERVRVDLAPAYDFQRADGAVNWAVIATKYTDEPALTFDNLEDTDSDGNPVVWQIRVTFLGRGDKVVGGGNSVTFEIPTSAGATVNFPEDVNLVDPVENPEYGPTWAAQAEASAIAAAASAAAAVAVGTTNDTIIAGRINTPGSATATALTNTIATLKQWAKNPDQLINGNITRNGNDVITSASVIWPDGTTGTFTTDAIASSGAINGYHITYGSPATKTFTQPTMTRNANGAVTVLPAIVVS